MAAGDAVTHEGGGARAACAIFAHRGARAHAPENTLLAFELAFALGADAVECDVQLTADGALVVIHDATLDRTTNGRGPVALATLAALRTLDAGRGQRIPLLAEVLDLCERAGRQVNLEVKAETAAAALATAGALAVPLRVLAPGARAGVVVSSFDLEAVAAIKRWLPWLRVATLHSGRRWRHEDALAPALALGAEAVHLATPLATPELIERAHRQALGVRVWTANQPRQLSQLLRWGVDGVFSDYPERAVIARALAASAG
ncbi:MAG TPA: glycerophosphodiester phosphodiesterase family protein [Ktedonobacterales bacterium]|nr:glycerophosphodiester phosphodiesterase family protein [Ktedonobacterales bacterium]